MISEAQSTSRSCATRPPHFRPSDLYSLALASLVPGVAASRGAGWDLVIRRMSGPSTESGPGRSVKARSFGSSVRESLGASPIHDLFRAACFVQRFCATVFVQRGDLAGPPTCSFEQIRQHLRVSTHYLTNREHRHKKSRGLPSCVVFANG